MTARLIWWAGPHSFENEELVDRMAAKVIAHGGIGQVAFLVDGAPGFARLMSSVAHKRGVHLLELKANYELWNHKAHHMRDVFIASTLPIDRLIAVHYLPLNGHNHREVQSAIDSAVEADINTVRVRVALTTALPSTSSSSAPGHRRRK